MSSREFAHQAKNRSNGIASMLLRLNPPFSEANHRMIRPPFSQFTHLRLFFFSSTSILAFGSRERNTPRISSLVRRAARTSKPGWRYDVDNRHNRPVPLINYQFAPHYPSFLFARNLDAFVRRSTFLHWRRYRASGIRSFEWLRGKFRNNGDLYSFIKPAAIRQAERHPWRLWTLNERIREIYGAGTWPCRVWLGMDRIHFSAWPQRVTALTVDPGEPSFVWQMAHECENAKSAS